MSSGAGSAPVALTRGVFALLVLSIGAASGTIHYHTPMLAVLAAEFGVDGAVVGWIPTMALAGFTCGVLFIAPLGDRIDKKHLILGKQAALVAGLVVMATATSIGVMIATAFVVGVGASQSQDMVPLATQLGRPQERGRNLGIMLSGLMIGILFGRVVGGLLTDLIGWRSAYWLAAAMLVPLLPLFAWRIPSTPRATQLGYVALLRSLVTLVTDSRALRTASLTQGLLNICYGAFWATVALMLDRLHGIGSTTAGLIGIPGAAGVLVWTNVGGATGGAILGLLTRRISLKTLTVVVLVISTVMVNVFGHGQANLQQLALICAATGFFTNAGVVGLYALFAQVFPTHVRATGTGFAIGFGRGGSALAPIIAGFLFKAGHGLQAVSLVFSETPLAHFRLKSAQGEIVSSLGPKPRREERFNPFRVLEFQTGEDTSIEVETYSGAITLKAGAAKP